MVISNSVCVCMRVDVCGSMCACACMRACVRTHFVCVYRSACPPIYPCMPAGGQIYATQHKYFLVHTKLTVALPLPRQTHTETQKNGAQTVSPGWLAWHRLNTNLNRGDKRAPLLQRQTALYQTPQPLPRHSAASRWRSGQAGAVKVKTAGAVMITDRPCGWNINDDIN